MGNRSKKRILHVSTKEIGLVDIPRVLDEMGYDVYHAQLGITALDYIKEDSDKISEAIEDYKVDYVTTYDFSESVAEACMKKSIPYISWVYDSPQKELYAYQAHYPSNYIFAFDKTQCEQLKQSGLKNVFHMPLAIHGEKVRRDLRKFPVGESHDIVFIGQLYKVKSLNEVIEQAPEEMKLEIKASIDNLFMKWDGKNKVYGSLSDDAAAFFNKYSERNLTQRYPYMPHGLYYEATVLSRVIANRERVHILNKLAENYDVNFYTRDKDVSQLNDKVKIHPGIGYDAGITAIYRDAKINLNITLHCIETGASQRIFDVMAAGGFLISNYQKELEELFIPNEDIVLYHNEEELLQLVDYYLSHEEERKRIARNGQRKVLAYHTLHIRFQKVMEIVYEKEKERKEDYIASQRKDIVYRTNQVLENQEDINTLYDIYNNPINALSITDESDLGIVKEMLLVREQEQLIKTGDIFKNIHSVDEAVTLFLHAKHILWRIENDCAYDVCQAGVEELIEHEISSVFLAYLIKSKLSDKRAVFLKLSEYIWNIKPMQALEIITYALFDFPDDEDLLMYKANYLLELQCFREALDTLKMIRKPNGDITAIIEELETTLGGK